MEGSKEVEGAPVVAGGDVSEVLELVEEAFDAVCAACGDFVMRDLDFSVAFGGDGMLDTEPYRSSDAPRTGCTAASNWRCGTLKTMKRLTACWKVVSGEQLVEGEKW